MSHIPVKKVEITHGRSFLLAIVFVTLSTVGFLNLKSTPHMQDWTSLKVGTQITEAQLKRLNQVKAGVQAHIASNQDRVWSAADPIRLWVSVLKNHPDACRINQQLQKEAASKNFKYKFIVPI